MGISGFVAGGVQEGLEQVLERRFKEAVRQQQEQQAAQQMAMQQQQIAGVEADRTANRDNQRRVIDLAELKRVDEQGAAATQRNAASDMAGVLAMPGMSNAAKANEIMGSGLRTGSVDPQKIIEGLTRVEKPERDPISDYEAKKKLDRQYDRPVAGPKPDRDPLADYEAKLKLDAKYKQPSGAADPVAEAKDTATEAKRLADALKAHPGLNGAFGVVDSRLPTLRQDTADAEVLRDSLSSLLTMENMGKMKGVLSDSDMKILKQASTTIAAPMSDAAARAELQRISAVMAKVANAPAQNRAPLTEGATVDVGGGVDTDRVAALIAKYGKGKK